MDSWDPNFKSTRTAKLMMGAMGAVIGYAAYLGMRACANMTNQSVNEALRENFVVISKEISNG